MGEGKGRGPSFGDKKPGDGSRSGFRRVGGIGSKPPTDPVEKEWRGEGEQGGVSEGTGREKCGRLLPCWTREPTRRSEEHGNWNRWNTRIVKLGTWRLVIRTLVGRTAILGRA
eukprot:scaffold239_cov382-Pavlova_lutheri.AAC.3